MEIKIINKQTRKEPDHEPESGGYCIQQDNKVYAMMGPDGADGMLLQERPDLTFEVPRNIEDSPERDQLLYDIFVTAIEGGIGYWAQSTEFSYKESNIKGFYTDVVDNETKEVFKEGKRIDRDTIIRGLDLFACGGISSDQEDLIKIADLTNDFGNMDADSCDHIVQAGLFGTLVFG